MQRYSNTDTLILACCEAVQAMARGFARGAFVPLVEADDLYQVGMLVICEAAASGSCAVDPIPYLVKCAKYAMCEEWRRLHGWSTESLDAPLSSSDDSFTLHDILPAPAPVASPAPKYAKSLDRALGSLTALQRGTVRRRYGLPGYGVSTLKETARALRTTVASVDHAGRDARRNLARDERLCEAVGVEVRA